MLGKQFISADQLNEIVRVLDVHLKEHFQRAAERLEKRKDEDFDEGVEEILEDEVLYFTLCVAFYSFTLIPLLTLFFLSHSLFAQNVPPCLTLSLLFLYICVFLMLNQEQKVTIKSIASFTFNRSLKKVFSQL